MQATTQSETSLHSHGRRAAAHRESKNAAPILEERQRTLTGDLERPETYADSNRAMHLNRELMGVADSLERVTPSGKRPSQSWRPRQARDYTH